VTLTKLRAHAFEVGARFVEAISCDWRSVIDIALAPEVPFAEVAGGVTVFLEHSRERRSLRIEPVRHASAFIVGAVVEVGSNTPALRILPSRQNN
jgi:hypothetical protein